MKLKVESLAGVLTVENKQTFIVKLTAFQFALSIVKIKVSMIFKWWINWSVIK